MTNIILKSNFQAHQKLVLILLFVVTFIIGSVGLWEVGCGESSLSEWRVGDFIVVMFFPLSIFILLNLLSKNGIVIEKSELFTSKFIFKKPWHKRKVDMTGMTDISILKFNGKQKFMFVTAGNPDKAYSVELQKAYVLNEKHTTKKLLFEVNNEEMAQEAVNKISKEIL